MRLSWIIASCMLLPATGVAVPTSRDTLTDFQDHQVHPLVVPDDIRTFVLNLGLDDAQQDIADARYQSYIDALEKIVEDAVLREQSPRDRLDGILQGRYRADPGEVVAIRVELVESKAANWPLADEQLDSLVEDIVAVGPAVDSETMDRARFELYRQIYLRPLRLEAGDSVYAGEGLDFFELAKAASKVELQAASVEAIQAILDTWRRAMQTSIRISAEAERAAALADRVARLNGDMPTRIEIMIERSKRWAVRKTIDYDTFHAIFVACPAPWAGVAWVDRYRRANYPWLWKTGDEVERISDWILENGSPEQIEVVNEVLPDYLARREELRLETEDILAEGRRTGANLCDDAAMDYKAAEESLSRLMRNSGQRTVLMRQARAELEQPLTSGQRAAVARLLLGL